VPRSFCLTPGLSHQVSTPIFSTVRFCRDVRNWFISVETTGSGR
jgi:hypothetical protein